MKKITLLVFISLNFFVYSIKAMDADQDPVPTDDSALFLEHDVDGVPTVESDGLELGEIDSIFSLGRVGTFQDEFNSRPSPASTRALQDGSNNRSGVGRRNIGGSSRFPAVLLDEADQRSVTGSIKSGKSARSSRRSSKISSNSDDEDTNISHNALSILSAARSSAMPELSLFTVSKFRGLNRLSGRRAGIRQLHYDYPNIEDFLGALSQLKDQSPNYYLDSAVSEAVAANDKHFLLEILPLIQAAINRGYEFNSNSLEAIIKTIRRAKRARAQEMALVILKTSAERKAYNDLVANLKIKRAAALRNSADHIEDPSEDDSNTPLELCKKVLGEAEE